MTASAKNSKNISNAADAVIKVQSFDISRSDETLELAKDLAKFIKDNKLTTNVQGKDFVNVEGWQYAGSRLGIVPVVEHVINVSSADEMKYQAKVTLFDMRHQTTVGAGFAVCSNKESGKKFYQEFAIMSMAQTRAIGKAYRNCLAWIIRAAGYEPTPAEEMDSHTTEAVVVPGKPAAEASAPASAPLVASTGGDQSKDEAAHAAEILRLTNLFEATSSTIELNLLWTREAKPYQKDLVAVKDAAKARIAATVTTAATEKVGPVITAPANLPTHDSEGQPIEYLAAEQKAEIVRLLNHPRVSVQKKSSVLLAINRNTRQQAAELIDKLHSLIDGHEGGEGHNALADGLKKWLREGQAAGRLPLKEAERLLNVAETASTADIRTEWMAAREAQGLNQEIAA